MSQMLTGTSLHCKNVNILKGVLITAMRRQASSVASDTQKQAPPETNSLSSPPHPPTAFFWPICLHLALRDLWSSQRGWNTSYWSGGGRRRHLRPVTSPIEREGGEVEGEGVAKRKFLPTSHFHDAIRQCTWSIKVDSIIGWGVDVAGRVGGGDKRLHWFVTWSDQTSLHGPTDRSVLFNRHNNSKWPAQLNLNDLEQLQLNKLKIVVNN